jgi:hypothetical protein
MLLRFFQALRQLQLKSLHASMREYIPEKMLKARLWLCGMAEIASAREFLVIFRVNI